jgi:hypothetical protein
VAAPVNDQELVDASLADRVHEPANSWFRDCTRAGDVVAFGGDRRDPSTPIIMSLRDPRDSPTAFQLPAGRELDAGRKLSGNIPPLDSRSDPTDFSAAAASERVLYIAEAHELGPVNLLEGGEF